MKRTGMTRPLDPLGRVTIPMEIRKSLFLQPGVRLEIMMNGSDIVLRRSGAFCACCGHTSDHMMERNGMKICRDCLERFQPVGGDEW